VTFIAKSTRWVFEAVTPRGVSAAGERPSLPSGVLAFHRLAIQMQYRFTSSCSRAAGALALVAALSGCAVATVAGAAAGAAISVAGAVVSTGVKVTGKVVEKTIDVVTPSSD
jgi:hypothetical protein